MFVAVKGHAGEAVRVAHQREEPGEPGTAQSNTFLMGDPLGRIVAGSPICLLQSFSSEAFAYSPRVGLCRLIRFTHRAIIQKSPR